MAASGASGEAKEPNGEKHATFSLAGEDIIPENEPKRVQSKPASRFKVAKVEFEDDRPKLSDDCGGGVSDDEDQADAGVQRSPSKESLNSVGKRKKHDSICSETSPPWSSYDTSNLKTFAHNTLETLPHMDHYRNLLSATGAMAMKKRPTLLELHEQDKEEAAEHHLLGEVENGHVQKRSPSMVTDDTKVQVKQAMKFGWIQGVLVRCLLNIYGVMLFLRLSWVVGQAGIAYSAVIILLAAVVTTITALSMSAICTNGQVKGGGAYFMISRCLGPEFGGPIGLIFSTANAVAVAMYVVGFAETIRDILQEHDCLMTDSINDVRIIGLITICFLMAIALIGMEWESRAQMILLVILLIAIANFVIGTFIPPSSSDKVKGVVGYQGKVFKDNWGPDFRDGESFFSVFSIFFPAATGILAGANISGDLADAQKAIPKGTLLAIVISTITYIVMGWMAGAVTLRDAPGYIPLIGNITMTTMAASITPGDSLMAGNGTGPVDLGYCSREDCDFGLQNDMQVMQLISGFGPITIAGIISATLSSALASLVSAPKVFQAVCKDKIFPGIHIFAKGYGKAEEPRRAYVLAFVIAIAFICIGSLNEIAPLISNFFLMSYALINYSCFDASLAKSPGWRPAFRYYSMWMSLLGAILCLIVMFVINWWTALITFSIVFALYVYVHYRKPDINWGSSTQAHVYRSALQHTLKLVSVLEHVKNFRPQVLALSGFPSDRPALVDIASHISKNTSLMVCGQVLTPTNGGTPDVAVKGTDASSETPDLVDLRAKSRTAYTWLKQRKIRSFYSVLTSPSMRTGVQSLLQCTGLGKMRPNTVLIGFKQDWKKASTKEEQKQVVEYVNIIHDAFDLRCGVGVLRINKGLNVSNLPQDESQDVGPGGDSSCGDKSPQEEDLPLVVKYEIEVKITKEGEENKDKVEEPGKKTEILLKSPKRGITEDVNPFPHKQKGTLDVWWLFDDGGLTLLVPYLLSTRSQWEKCKLRVFIAGTKKSELDRDQRHMATLLSKFRIEYSSMKVVSDIGKKPKIENRDEFAGLIKQWMGPEDDDPQNTESCPWKITESELTLQLEKTNRHIRLRELLQEHSKDASLIVMTLPMPRKGMCSAGLYMAWLDTLTKNLPPIMLLRGNQESVLTFYS